MDYERYLEIVIQLTIYPCKDLGYPFILENKCVNAGVPLLPE
jgi:hypothetical protein